LAKDSVRAFNTYTRPVCLQVIYHPGVQIYVKSCTGKIFRIVGRTEIKRKRKK
jgi:hypothetical protein